MSKSTRQDKIGEGSSISIELEQPQLEQQMREQSLLEKITTFDKKAWTYILYMCWMVLFLLGVAWCVVSLCIKSIQTVSVGGLDMWQWSLIITSLLGGPILSRSLLYIILLLLDHESSLRINAIYYIVELVESATYVLWSGILLLAWSWVSLEPTYLGLSPREKKQTEDKLTGTKPITTTLITILIVSILWLIKNLLIVMMKSSFHFRVFFDRIRVVCRHHQAMKSLTNDSLFLKPFHEDRLDHNSDDNHDNDHVNNVGKLCNIVGVFKKLPICRAKKLSIDERPLMEEKNQQKVSCWDMKELMNEIKTTKFVYKKSNTASPQEINSENMAEVAADLLFSKLLRRQCHDLQNDTIEIDDKQLKEHVQRNKASQMLQWFENAGFDNINQENVRKYMVWAFKYHAALVRGLHDNGGLFRDLNRCANLVLCITAVVLWFLIAKKEYRDIIIFIGSGIVASAFAFADFCKKMLDNFSFVFLMHPFDAGDYCFIDGTSVIIEDVDLLSTVATTLDDHQIHFPNAVLVGKNIINYTRSSNRSDSVVFYLQRCTRKSQIDTLREKIDSYIKKSRYWDKRHNLGLEYAPEDSDNIKATLNLKHIFSYYEPTERKVRKSELIEHLNTVLLEMMDQNNVIQNKNK